MNARIGIAAVGVAVVVATIVLIVASRRPSSEDRLAERLEALGPLRRPIVQVPSGLTAAAAWLEDHRKKHALAARLFDAPAGERDGWSPDEWKVYYAYLESLEPYLVMADAAVETPRAETTGDAEKWLRDLYTVVLARADQDRTPQRAVAYAHLLYAWGGVKLPYLSGTRVRRLLLAGPARVLDLVHDKRGFEAGRYRAAVEPLLIRAEPEKGPAARPLREQRIWHISFIANLAEQEDFRRPAQRAVLFDETLNYLDEVERAIAACDVAPKEADDFQASDDGIRDHFRGYIRFVTRLRLARAALAGLEHKQSTGRWPDRVPPPNDPLTGRPFAYTKGSLRAETGQVWPP